MTTIIQILTAAALVLSIIVPFGAFFLGEKTKKRYKKSLACNGIPEPMPERPVTKAAQM